MLFKCYTTICWHVPILVKLENKNGQSTWRPTRVYLWLGEQSPVEEIHNEEMPANNALTVGNPPWWTSSPSDTHGSNTHTPFILDISDVTMAFQWTKFTIGDGIRIVTVCNRYIS
jgi:hypothetical protein